MMHAVPSSDPTERHGNGSATTTTTTAHVGNESGDPTNDLRRTKREANSNEDLLVVWQGVALLTADCMGVGVLGLPNDIKSLGYAAGFAFLLGNFPINYYAGNLLSVLALQLEGQQDEQRRIHRHGHDDDDENDKIKEVEMAEQRSGPQHTDSSGSTPSFQSEKKTSLPDPSDSDDDERDDDKPHASESFQDELPDDKYHQPVTSSSVPTTNITRDLINITEVTFDPDSSIATALVKAIYYTNLFLVLGDYILVMGRSVSAIFADDICLPTAGAIASALMFGLCQFRTMANLGRNVSLASLIALLIVLLQCLFHHRMGSTTNANGGNDDVAVDKEEVDDGIWGKLSSLAGIGFAVGSQKLFLNIRNELRHRDQASKVLAGSLGVYGLAYVFVIVLAGPDPPSFLFDSIPEGWSRRLAGLLLWFHVAVSYAINNQALCTSLDQLFVRQSYTSNTPLWSKTQVATRWFTLSLAVSVSSYLVSNAIPFFKALVGLIGALTSVPLSLTLPAILHRRARHISLLLPDRSCASTDSYLLFLYSTIFLGIGLVGAISSIDEGWMNHGKPFSCSM